MLSSYTKWLVKIYSQRDNHDRFDKFPISDGIDLDNLLLSDASNQIYQR